MSRRKSYSNPLGADFVLDQRVSQWAENLELRHAEYVAARADYEQLQREQAARERGE